MGENKTNDYTTEQLLDENLKNIYGESNVEVRKRMLDFLEEALNKHEGKRIVLVSHGAAIKFLLQHFCNYDFVTNSFIFEKQTICSAKLESPSVLKLWFNGDELKRLEKIIF